MHHDSPTFESQTEGQILEKEQNIDDGDECALDVLPVSVQHAVKTLQILLMIRLAKLINL